MHGNAKHDDGVVKWARGLREEYGYTVRHIAWIVQVNQWTVRSWLDYTNRGDL